MTTQPAVVGLGGLLSRARAGLRRRTSPLVEVVVVVDDHNAPVLTDCLSALAGQARGADRVLVVDTGRFRVTGRSVAEAVALTPALRAEVRAAGGATKAEALRHGLDALRGQYVVLLDAGDRLAPGALEALAGSLDESGAPLAVAGPTPARRVVLADVPGLVRRPSLATRMFRRAALDVELAEEPLLDWLPGVRSLLGASCFDVVENQVLAGPRRGGGAAFGTMPARAPSAPEWAGAVDSLLQDPRLAPARAEFAAWALTDLAPEYLDDAERCPPSSWQALSATLSRLLQALPPSSLARVPAVLRTHAWLAAQGRRADVEALAVQRWLSAGQFPTQVDDGRVRAVLPVAGVPAEMLEMGAEETPLVTQPWTARHRDDGGGEVEVSAFVRGVGDQHGPVEATLTLRSPGGAAHVLETDVRPDPDAGRRAQERHQEHLRARLAGRLPGDVAARAVGPGWRLEVLLRVAGVERRGVAPGPVVPSDAPWRITAWELDGTRLRARGTGPAGAETTLELHGPAGPVSAPVRATEAFDVTLVLERDPWGLGRSPLPSGAYRLLVRAGRLALAHQAAERTLLRSTELRVRAETGPRAVRLAVGPPLADDEVGACAQERLQSRYRTSPPPVDAGLVLLQSYTGQACTDSPRAVHEALRELRTDLRLVWSVADRGTPVPPGARPVLMRSGAWYDALASAGYLVTNVDMDRWFTKRPGQRLLQTYHGYPAKTMGLSAWRAKNLTDGRIERLLARTSGTWDLLLTPTPAMDRYYREEYRYAGPIHSAGYPRNDVLVGSDAPRLREEARRRLGVAGRTVVLYAPTWRDDLATDFRAAPMDRGLDVDAAAAALGEQVVLLLRGHRFHRRRPGPGDRVLDVTDYPEVNDLILASDVAVLDYSSLRFDFALTGRPMVFLVPDLERYETGVRGFLYDFRSSAPGPLLDTTDEVVEALRDIPGLAAAHRDDLARFNAAFNDRQDGRAAERVVAAFFGSRE